MRILVSSLLLAAMWLQPNLAIAETKITIADMPPVVVSTIPRAGALGVDPGQNTIKVTFSKPMQTQRMWSWVMVSKESFPKIVGPVRFLADQRTCVAPVKLTPGKTYAIWFNTAKHNHFRDRQNKAAVPYLLVFQTKK
ncbi:MAG: Ig-like domain-containing protein [Desulfarculaceae bacterium]|jgi:hypothetical protein